VVLADFEIAVEFEEVPRSVRVVVYDSLKGLRIAATRHEHKGTRRSRRKQGQFKDTLGICHRFERYKRDGTRHPQCAIVRLAHPNLGVGITSHELLHAAVWMLELNGHDEPLTCANDEPLAWLVGELVRQTINTMNENGVFEKLEGVEDP
jgi:hypothetical protein